MWRAFEADWAKCMLKEERFTNLVKKGLKGDDDPEMQAVKQVLREHYNWSMYLYLVHASNDVTATEAAYMGWLSYGDLMVLAGITDANSKACKQTHLDTIFKVSSTKKKTCSFSLTTAIYGLLQLRCFFGNTMRTRCLHCS